jgi:phage baseplate assembly protein W
MVDFRLDLNTGDLVLDPDGDFALVSGDEQMIQEVVFSLKTTKGDWTLSSRVGCDLEQFIGKANDPTTLNQISSVVRAEIATLESVGPFQVYTAPLDDNTVVIAMEFVSRDDPKRKIQVAATLDLMKGRVFARTDVI